MVRSMIATTLVTSALAFALPIVTSLAEMPSPTLARASYISESYSGAARAQYAGTGADARTASADSDSADDADTTPVAAANAVAGSESACPAAITGATGAAPAISAADGAITGTTATDLAQFAQHFNETRVANCLEPVPFENFRYDSCLETRLIWMAEDPSTDPSSAWGHEGSVRSDGVPSIGCDGNLAGGSDNDGAVVAQKWWDSLSHRASLYRPDIPSGTDDVCVIFAMTHGGVPNETSAFVRAAARWVTC